MSQWSGQSNYMVSYQQNFIYQYNSTDTPVHNLLQLFQAYLNFFLFYANACIIPNYSGTSFFILSWSRSWNNIAVMYNCWLISGPISGLNHVNSQALVSWKILRPPVILSIEKTIIAKVITELKLELSRFFQKQAHGCVISGVPRWSLNLSS